MEIEKILKKAKNLNINFANIWFTDIAGKIKTFAFSLDKLKASLDEGLGFDGSSVTGFQDIDESDLIIKPDLDTAMFFDNNILEIPSLIFLGNIYTPQYKRYEGDGRYILSRNIKRLLKKDEIYNTGAELEFFFFKKGENLDIIDRGSYFDLIIFDEATKILNEVANILNGIGIETEYYHHEVGDSQFELDLRYTNAEKMADNVIIARALIKKIASKHGIYASFMPKPLYKKAGNGLHTHISIFKKGKNLMAAGDGLSRYGQSFLSGTLKYIKEITLATNPTVNSFKRLVPGYEAPVYVAWGMRNRSSLVRVPQYNAKKPKSIRIEVRNPDPSCNPYIAYSSLLASGIKGVQDNLKPPKPIEFNIYSLSEKDVLVKGIDLLPDSLASALNFAKNGNILREVLGKALFEKYISLKSDEWQRYKSYVTKWEIEEYYYEF